MATMVIEHRDEVPTLEQPPLSIPLSTYAENGDSAERAEPEPMQPTPVVRNRGVEGRSARTEEGTSAGSATITQTTPLDTTEDAPDQEEGYRARSLSAAIWQGVSNVLRHGTLSTRTREQKRLYDINHGYNLLRYNTDVDLPEGFPQLAYFLNSNDSFAVYRRFGELSARTLVQLEIDLTDLEKEQRELDTKDAADKVLEKRLRGYEGFHKWDKAQRELGAKTHAKLCEYFDLLLRDTQVRALGQAPKRHHLGLFNWIWNNKPLAEGKHDFILHADDFVSAAQKSSRLGDFIEAYADRWPDSRIKNLLQTKRERSMTTDPYVDHYSKDRFALLIKTITVALAVGILFVPVLLLFLVDMSHQGKAWTLFGFVLAFSIIISVVTEAKVHEILIGTAAYAAVLVTLLGNMNGGSGLGSAT